MKFSPARMILILLVVLGGTAALLLSQEGIVVGEAARNEVRMPVDTRIIELEDPVKAPQLVEEQKQGEAAGATPAEKVEEAVEAAKPAPEPEKAEAPKPEPSKEAERPAPRVPTGAITGLGLKMNDNGSFTVTAQGDDELGRVRVLWVKNPDRLVLDIMGKWQLRTRNVVRLKGGPVKHMVAGEHKDMLRLVIHFRTPAAWKKKPVIKVDGKSGSVSVFPEK